MKIATSKTREQFPLSPKKIFKKTLASSLGLIILAGAVIIGLIIAYFQVESSPGSGYLLLAVFGVLILFLIWVLLIYLYQRWYFAVYYYDLDPDYIVIKKGPITPHEITIPYERIQDVYVDQDLLDRILGLYDVHLSSATISSGMAAHIDGVERASADGLRAKLLATVGERISKKKPPAPPAPMTPPQQA